MKNKIFIQRGFTLVELMITIGVMAIIAVMAVPSFTNMLLKQNLNKSTRDLVIVLEKARSKAGRINKDEDYRAGCKSAPCKRNSAHLDDNQ